MQTLQRVLAHSVLEALEAREHVLVAPGSGEALLDEVENIIAPTLANITPHLCSGNQVMGEVTSTFGDEAADEAVEDLVDNIAERLMESDHVDDIFAEDRLIRRDAFRAIREILRLYAEGDLDVSDGCPCDSCPINLDELGYVVSTVAQLAEERLLRTALERAGAAAGVAFESLDIHERQAVYELSSDNPDGRLVLEEAITEELVDLVDNDMVELPSVEQILQLAGDTSAHPDFEDALVAAARDTQQHTNCAAACTVVDRQTLLATLTPLSEEDACNSESHFAYFIQALERALASLSETTSSSADEGGRKKKSRRRARAEDDEGSSGAPDSQKTKAKRQARKKKTSQRSTKNAKSKRAKKSNKPAPGAERSATTLKKAKRAK